MSSALTSVRYFKTRDLTKHFSTIELPEHSFSKYPFQTPLNVFCLSNTFNTLTQLLLLFYLLLTHNHNHDRHDTSKPPILFKLFIIINVQNDHRYTLSTYNNKTHLKFIYLRTNILFKKERRKKNTKRPVMFEVVISTQSKPRIGSYAYNI